MTVSCVAYPGEIAELQVNVVKYVADIVLGRDRRWQGFARILIGFPLSLLRCRFVPGLFNRKLLDDLRLAIIEQLKIFLPKVANRFPTGIAHYDALQYQVHLHFERREFIMRADFLRRIAGRLR